MQRIRRLAAGLLAFSFIGAGVLAAWPGAPVASAAAGGNDKVTICHSTAADTNPWVVITISANAVDQHFALHKDHNRDNREDFIVPAGTTTEQCQAIGGGPG